MKRKSLALYYDASSTLFGTELCKSLLGIYWLDLSLSFIREMVQGIELSAGKVCIHKEINDLLAVEVQIHEHLERGLLFLALRK
ncbi:hypothetical protein Bca4012_085191 [Brassica carinata]